MNSADICTFFFIQTSEGVYQCKCGIKRKRQKTSGYTNLMSHLKEKHPDWEKVYSEFRRSNPGKKKADAGAVFFMNPKAVNIHNWLKWVINRNLPLSSVEEPEFREFSNLENISSDTLTKYLRLVDVQIDSKLKNEMPARFGIVIDGWTEGTTHYYGLFAAYSKGNCNYQRFLTISPPFDETTYGAESQAAFIVDTVEALERSKEGVIFLVGDNTSTNPRTASLLGIPFIGCASLRLNLAVQNYLENYEEILGSINEIM
jgi:hypothetical protein